MLGFPILYCKGMRPMMFQLSGFCYKRSSFNLSLILTAPILNPRATLMVNPFCNPFNGTI